jgi:hypothetical protein
MERRIVRICSAGDQLPARDRSADSTKSIKGLNSVLMVHTLQHI